MSRCGAYYDDFSYPFRQRDAWPCERPCPRYPFPYYCMGPAGPQGPVGPTGPAAPFLSSYLEASGSAQTILTNGKVVFDAGAEDVDIVGSAFQLDPTGTVIRILQPGLYHVEWSVNLTNGTAPILLGTLENGAPGSAHANAATSGSYGSGALISVSAAQIPFTVSLQNFGANIEIGDTPGFAGVAASIRIVKIADGPR